MENKGWDQRKSLTLRKTNKGYFVDLYWKKPDSGLKQGNQAIGIDVGIQKLMTLSDGQKLGTGLRQKLDKLNRRQQKSHNWDQTCKEIKDYIGYVTNRFPWKSVDVIVMEQILNITKSTKGRVNKTLRKLLGHWNLRLLYRRMVDKATENRVSLALVDPAYSSQTCSSCGSIDKKSRIGEVFRCVNCGYSLDADHNASLNILQRFLDGHYTVAHCA